MSATSPPAVGDPAPPFDRLDQHGERRTLADFAGRPVLVYFYPKADTPGCTTQSCLMRDLAPTIETPGAEGPVIIGVSPDAPEKQKKFDDKYSLGFPLLSDPDHAMAEAYGVWGEKKLYGKAYMGIVRSAFLIGPDGAIAAAFPKISPKDTPVKLAKALAGLAT